MRTCNHSVEEAPYSGAPSIWHATTSLETQKRAVQSISAVLQSKWTFGQLYHLLCVWERIPRRDIVPLASGQVKMVEIPRSEGGGLARRIDGILALNRVLPVMITDAHRALCEALDDDEGVIRIAGLIAMPSFAIKKHDDLFIYLSDRLLEENEQVRKVARDCLRKVAPIFPSGCEEILRRELRHEAKQHRNDAFATLKETSRNWVETGCLHLDELIREDDVDLRRRGAKILRTITAKGGATGWDLITWSLQDEDAQVRRSASACLPTLANIESRVATILVESSMFDEDSGVKKNVIKALKTLDMESPSGRSINPRWSQRQRP